MDGKELIARGDNLFQGRSNLLSLWQEIAENFYPQRADFTVERAIGDQFAGNLNSSYPILVHRELSTSFASMLRKRDTEWFRMTINEDDDLSLAARQWLEMATKRQRRVMYDPRAKFIRATTEGDADFAAFGQCCISHEINWNAPTPHMLYRSWHLRDVAWSEGYDCGLQEIHIKWKPTVRELKQMFPAEKLDANILAKTDKHEDQKILCRRVLIKEDLYQMGTNWEWVLVYIDCDNEHVIDRIGVPSPRISLPRWQTVSGSQYAYSPATVAGLPDARLLQAMTLTLLEAGEMAVRPPMIATRDAIREDVNLYAGGITWADAQYDERLGEVLRPLSQDKSGLPYGMEVAADQREMLAAAFFLNKLTLPPSEGDMTATEVRERIAEYIRAAIPLFEPMEVEYNAPLCENTFDELMRAGVFGAPQDVPQELQGRDIHFTFISPLHDAVERETAATFMETKELIAQAIELDPVALAQVNVREALKDALEAIRSPADWQRTDDEIDEIVETQRRQQAAERAAEVAQQAGQAANEVIAAEQQINAA